jgi:hydrogenase maturation protein HypF
MATARRSVHVDGIVQGVGYRPFVFNMAESLGLVGWVSNTSDGVFIEVEGDAAVLDGFVRSLECDAPPLAVIAFVDSEDIPTTGDTAFSIRISEDTPGTATLVSPDVAVCTDCLTEIRDPGDRRHGYPFTNCTNCGPRLTIIDRIPYDRPFTSMAPFAMCGPCRTEYENPRDRRFHAQPNACPACGPRVWLEGSDVGDGTDTLAECARLLAAGRIGAIKGLGGFHLGVRANDQEAVARLRERKHREAKPLAVMVADLETARALAHLDGDETDLLTDLASPIVLLRRRDGTGLAAAVASGHRRVGLMLPYTPLHHLLFDALAAHGVRALVMTSGNASDEPICLGNAEARERLADIADFFLLHDRDILRRADDSVAQVLDARPLLFRRSRGYAPVPVFLRGADGPPVLAVGAELKNTVCLLKEDRPFLSPHVGDLKTLQAHDFFRETIGTLQALFECEPDVVAHDLHPDYLSTRWAREQTGKTLVPVQHHHAHLVSVLADHGIGEPAVGLILDGTGYGLDGTIWGGELLFGNAAGFERLGHLETVPLPGGDAAIRQPWRTALSYLRHAYGQDLPDLPMLRDKPVAPVLDMIDKGINAPSTSSAGRLFDAVAALTGRWDTAEYEAQAAIELMALTDGATVASAQALPWDIAEADDKIMLAHAPLIRGVVAALAEGTDAAMISARFHRTVIDMLLEAARRACARAGVKRVVLSGGVFQNEILMSGTAGALADAGLDVLTPLRLPANDGGLALGQAVAARS